MNQDYIKKDLEVISKLEFNRVEFVPTQQSQPFIIEMKEQFNGQIKIIKIEVYSEQPHFWGSLAPRQFLNELINQPNFKSVIHDLEPFPDKVELVHHIDTISSLYSLIGDLCSKLAFGGAYSNGSKLEPSELLSTVKKFVEEFLPGGYLNYHYYYFFENWTGWFANVAWDSTYLLIDRNGKEISLICVTDSD